MRAHTVALAKRLGRGRADQRAVRDQERRRLRARGEPARQSRTIPFVSKATGVPLASARGARDGRRDARRARASLRRCVPPYVAVKEAVFPFNKFRECRSDARPGDALDRRGDGHRRLVRHRRSPRRRSRRTTRCRSSGAIFVTVNDSDKADRDADRRAASTSMGFRIFATEGTARYLRAPRHPGRAGAQGARGPAQRHRPDRQRRRCSC